VTGAFAEVLAGFQTIKVYYNLDNNPGFQYTLGTDMWTNCNNYPLATPTVDCTYEADNIQLSGLTWTSVTHIAYPCTGTNDPSNCTAHIFSMTGSTNGTSNAVVKLDFTVATHPVLVTGPGGYSVSLDGDRGEIDVTINYPWTSLKNTRPNPSLALLTSAGGKAGVGGAVFAAGTTSAQVSFSVSAGKGTTFGWLPQATTPNNTNSQVYVQTYTDTEINSKCGPLSNCSFAGAILVVYLKIVVGVINGFGWACEFIIFSWSDTKPTTLTWDPNIGSASTSTPGTSSPAGTVYVSLIVMLVSYLAHHLF